MLIFVKMSDNDDEFILLFKQAINDEGSLELTEFMSSEARYTSVFSNVITGVAQNRRRETHIRPKLYAENIVPEMSEMDFYKLYRMCQKTFNNLLQELNTVNPSLQKKYVGGNNVISIEKKLLVTLTYLGSQMTYLRIGELFNLAPSSVCNIVHECVKAVLGLQLKYIRWPSKSDCEVIANKFQNISNFPCNYLKAKYEQVTGVIGAIDGSHINVKVPENQQVSRTNRKMGKSIILQGVSTSDKIFINVCVGMPGSAHDARVLSNSNLYKAIEKEGQVSLFYDKYHILGDSAYPLKEWLLTPFKDYGNLTRKQKKFNTALSKTRCVIENTFGLLKGRWRRLQYIDILHIEFASDVVMACCILHNYCLLNNDSLEEPFYEEPQCAELQENINPRKNNADGALKRNQIMNSMNL